MNKLLALVALLVGYGTAFALSISAPSSVNSGTSYTVTANHWENNSWPYGIGINILKNGANVGGNGGGGVGYVNVTASYSSTDTGPQVINYQATATGGNGSVPPANTSVTINPPPNDPPTITWVQAPGSVPVNQWFAVQARGNDQNGNLSEVKVWREWNPFAFNGGGNGFEGYSDANQYQHGSAGSVTFMAQAFDSSGATSSVIYHTVNIYVPNVAPSIAWNIAPPDSAWINQTFTVQAVAYDGNSNLTWINVWRADDGGADQAFAFNGGGNGSTAYSDNNAANKGTTGTMTFKAQAGDASGATSGIITKTVTINNRAPSGSFTINGVSANATAVFGQTVAIASNVSDPDGNMSVHSYWWDQGSGLTWTHPVLTWNYAPNAAGWLNTNLGGNGYDASGATSSRGFDFRATKVATFAFHNVVADPYAWIGVGPSVLYLTVNRATPNQTGWSDKIWTGTGAAPNGAFSVTFSNPYSLGVAAPTGSPTFTVVGSSGAGASPTTGVVVDSNTVFYPGTYTVSCTYPGDANYNGQSWNATFTVNNRTPTAAMSIKGVSSGTTTGIITENLTIGVSGADADGNLRAVNLWVATPSIGWRNIRADSSLAAGFTESNTTDNAINSPTNVSTLGSVNRNFTLPAGGGTGLYQFVVRSIDAIPAASTSQQVNVDVSKANQATLVLNGPAGLTYGASQTLSTSGGSGTGAVTYAIVAQSLAGVATLSGNVVTANAGTGWVDLRATKAADNDYNAATSNTFRVTLNKAPLTVTADNKTRVYGEDNPAFTATYTGLINGDTSAVVSGITMATTATPTSAAGPYPITISGGTAANYSITPVPGTLTVSRKRIYFSFENTTLVYNAAEQKPTVMWRFEENGTPVPAPVDVWAYRNPPPPPPNGSVYATSATLKNAYYFEVEGIGNYYSEGYGACAWSIVCCTAQVHLGNLTGHTYDGSSKVATATTTNPSGLNVIITYNGSTALPVNAGIYAVHGEVSAPVDEHGQQWGGYADATLEIAKANQAPLTLAATSTLVYNTTKNLNTLLTATGSGNGVVTYAITGQSATGVASISGSVLTANTGTGWVDIQATKPTGTDGNYNPTTSTNTLRVTFAKADQPSLTLNANTSQTYLATQTLSATGGASGAGSLSYTIRALSATGAASLSGTGSSVLTANTGTGWVEVRATRAGNNNYNVRYSNTVRVNFAKKVAPLVLGNLTHVYDGTPKAATATTTPTGLPVDMKYNGVATVPSAAGIYMIDGTINHVNYQGLASTQMEIQKATPVITWQAPASITYGTKLGATQLNATATTTGAFVYTPAANTVLNAGGHTLNVVFNAADTTNYVQGIAKSVPLTVNQATPVGSFTGNTWAINHVLTAQDLNASFAHPDSSALVPAPAAAVTYSVISVTGTFASPTSGPVTVGTKLLPGIYTIRAAYAGEANYQPAQVDATFTITLEPNGDADSDGMTNKWEQDNGLDPSTEADVLLDPDKDGLPNITEFNLNKNPQVYDQGTSTLGGTIPAGWPNAAGGSNHAANLAVGATAGELNVDKSGAATYSVPIWTTPGTAGMQPQVSLNYSSQAGAGIAGFGWSLGGISAISRGPTSIAVDNYVDGVDFDANDQFYLDGQRLIWVSGNPHGQAGAVYHTEMETFTRVEAFGSRGAYSPARFKAQTKAGLTIWFGCATSDSINDAATFDAINSGNEPLSWHVSRIEDTSGNYMTFTYEEDVTDRGHRLTQIDYTGNGITVSPYASLVFGYEARSDIVRGYSAGSPVSSLKRLKTITSKYGSEVARTYTLGYTERGYTGRSLLTSLTEAGSDGKAYPALTFEYGTPIYGWDQEAPNFAFDPAYALADNRGNNNKGYPTGTGFVDLNGDGRVDFIVKRDNQTGSVESKAMLNTGTGWTESTNYRLPYPLAFYNTTTTRSDDTGGRFIDFDGDGLVDFVAYKLDANGALQTRRSWKNNGNGWTEVYGAWLLPAPVARDSSSGNDFSKQSGRFADMNGDGRADFIAFLATGGSKVNIAVYLNNGTGWDYSAHGAYSTNPVDLADKQARFLDLNGDGLPDIVASYKNGGSVENYIWLNNGAGWDTNTSYHLPTWIAEKDEARVGAEFVDMNGDGLVDIIWARETPQVQTGFAINTGKGWNVNPVGWQYFGSPAELGREDSGSGGATFMDFNADGLPDLMMARYLAGASSKSVHIGSGSGWQATSDTSWQLPEHLLVESFTNVGIDFPDFDGDGVADMVWKRWAHWGALESGLARNKANPIADRLQKVTNGLGVKAEITYKTLLDPTVYTKGGTVPAPAGSVDIAGPMYVVSTVKHDDGVSGQYPVSYRYEGLRSERVRGSLGFALMEVTDGNTGIKSQTTFSQDFPYIGMPVKSKTISGAVTMKDTLIAYGEKPLNAGKTRFIFAKDSDEISRDLDGSELGSVSTEIPGPDPTVWIDPYGNILKLVVTTTQDSTGDAFAKTTVSLYDNHTGSGKWQLGRLSSSTVTNTAPSAYGSSITRSSAFTYDPVTGLLKTEVVEPNDATGANKLTTTYGYDQFGNKTSVEVRGKTLTVNTDGSYNVGADVWRTTSTEYYPNGRFPKKTTNAVGHEENYNEYDEKHGVLKKLTGANSIVTTWNYDGFGRKIREDRAVGTASATATETRYRWVAGSPGSVQSFGTAATALYSVETESTGTPPSIAFHDAFGRAFVAIGINGDGRMVYQTKQYDSRGRAFAASTPYFADTTASWSYTLAADFDVLNRPRKLMTPDDENGTQTILNNYQGLQATATDPKGRVSRTTRNVMGWTLANTRNEGAGVNADDYSSVSYEYDAIGNLKKTIAAGTETTLNYDLRGRKTSMVDADMGTWQYRYNAFGELIWQKDQKGQVTTMIYDALGRLITRTETEGTTDWLYDLSSAGGAWKGKLASVVVANASQQTTYAENYTYDSLGRPTALTRTIDGTPYTTQTTYDSWGRVVRTVYPAYAGSTTLSTRNVYNSFSYLKEVRNWIASDEGKTNHQLEGRVYWMADSYSVTGQINGETYGNGLANDRAYSAVTGRLTRATIDRGRVVTAPFFVQDLNYSYDAMGNVLSRIEATTGFARDERFYNSTPNDGYDGLDRLKVHRVVSGSTVTVSYYRNGNIRNKSDVGDYAYSFTPVGRTNALPHAVSTAGTNTYTYDAVGNMLSGAGRSLDWTSFNQVKKITQGNLSTEFSFGAGHERVMQLRKTSNVVTERTIYVGGLYEKVITGTVTEHKHYIMGPTGRIAVHTERSDLSRDTRWLHTDGLGSVTVISDESGRVLKRHIYDAWGKQITAYTNTTSGITNTAPTTRGYTDHEMLSDFGLIHMNGRVYDPTLGRFLSADPNVDGVSDAQGFNRYSYVGNNPMNATDPTGYFSLKELLPAIIAIVVTAVVIVAIVASGGTAITGLGSFFSALQTGLGTTAAIWGGAAGGFAGGFSGSLLNGGSIGDAFKAGVIGAAVGAATAWASGQIGGFFGADNGTFSQWGGRTLAHATVGGLASEAQGGSFRHGFYSSAASVGFMHSGAGRSLMGSAHIAVRTATAAVIGGTASVLGGGKFANGAVTSAFQHLFNQETGNKKERVAVLMTKEAANEIGRIDKGDGEIVKQRLGDYVKQELENKSNSRVDLKVFEITDPAQIETYAKSYDTVHVWGHGGKYTIRIGAHKLSPTYFDTRDFAGAMKEGYSLHELQSPRENMAMLADQLKASYGSTVMFHHCRGTGGFFGDTSGQEIMNAITGRHGL